MAPVPQSAACINCGETLASGARYCGGCGQDHRYPRLRLRELAGDAFVELVSFDRPWIATLRGLFPEAGTMARDYAAGHRAGRVAPVRFMLVSIAILLVVAELCRPFLPGRQGHAWRWMPVGMIAYALPLAWLLRAFCRERIHDLAEIMVFVCYATGIGCLSVMLWFNVVAAVVFSFATPGAVGESFVVATLVLYSLIVPAYFAWSLTRFFRYSWWRGLASAYFVGAVGMIGALSLSHGLMD